jgi:hypothetical protein
MRARFSRRGVAVLLLAGVLFFGAAFFVSRSIKRSTNELPAGAPAGVVIESEAVTVPGGGPALPDIPAAKTPRGRGTTSATATGTGTGTTGTGTTGTGTGTTGTGTGTTTGPPPGTTTGPPRGTTGTPTPPPRTAGTSTTTTG